MISKKSQWAVVRALLRETEPLTGREVARKAGVSVQSANQALGDMEKLGLVSWRPAGKAQLFRLNQEHELVKEVLRPLLSAEEKYADKLRGALSKIAGNDVLSVTLFGSAGRGEEIAGSDFDLFVTVQDEAKADLVRERIAEAADSFERRFHGRISSIVCSLQKLERRWGKTELIRAVATEGLTLAGKPLKDLLKHG